VYFFFLFATDVADADAVVVVVGSLVR